MLKLMKPNHKPLGTFSLVMINIIAIDNLRTLPFAAKFGLPLVSLYLIASIVFLIPVGIASAKLATAFPNKGGIYVWIKQAFGKKVSFFIIWLQWIYNVVWYPTALAFILAIIAHAFGYQFLQNKTIFLTMIILMFWLATLLNCFGMRISGAISNICAILGTLIPMLIMIILGCFWLYNHNTSHLTFNWHMLLPDQNIKDNLPFLVEIIFGLVGLEMSAMHADQVANPKKAYPLAIFWSVIIIFISLTCSSLSIALIIPKQELSLMTGISQAMYMLLHKTQMDFLYPTMIVLIILSSIGSISAWIIGPTKGLLIAAEDGIAPRYFTKLNKKEVPTRILVLQAILVTVLAGFYIWMPDLESAYIMLTVMTTQLSLIVYIGLFLATWKLRHNFPKLNLPCKNRGILTCCIIGVITCIAVIILGFIPPKELISSAGSQQYICTLALGMIILCLPPIIICKKKIKQN